MKKYLYGLLLLVIMLIGYNIYSTIKFAEKAINKRTQEIESILSGR